MMKTSMVKIFALLFMGTGILSAQSMTADEVLRNVKKQFDLVTDYTVDLKITVDMEKMQIPEMLVKLYFKKPDKVYVESKSFSMVPRDAVGMNPAQFIDKFDATLMETQQKDGVSLYKIKLVSKPEKGKPARESYIWVDGDRWVVTHFESSPSEVRKVIADLEYEKIGGKYILPSKVELRMETQQSADSTAEKMYPPQRMPRKGKTVILYSDYKVNTGLSDDIFQKKEQNSKQ